MSVFKNKEKLCGVGNQSSVKGFPIAGKRAESLAGIISVLLLYLVLYNVIGLVSGAVPVTVDFPDPYLEAAVREALGKPSGDITDEDMAGLTWLTANTRGIHDLAGLEYATNLGHLELGQNPILDLSPLAGLTNLQYLVVHCLAWDQFSDLSPLAGLSNLQYLDASSNMRVSDLSPLAGLSSLKELVLDSCRIGEVSPLAGLTNLEKLVLDCNEIIDLSPLAGLTNLETLLLNGNRGWGTLSDLSPLAGLTNLQHLQVGYNRISDLSPLAGLTNLQYLLLRQDWVTDISALVANSEAGGLGPGDSVYLEYNVLSLSEGSKAMTDIQTLISNGVFVAYEPQYQPPVAEAGGPYEVHQGWPVTLDGSGSIDLDDEIVRYEWDFGDGETGEGVTVQYTYSQFGSYTVTLTVWDYYGLKGVDTSTVTVKPLIHAEAGGPYEGFEGEPVLFDASDSVSDPVQGDPTYWWDWNTDGVYDESSASPSITHTWYDDHTGTVTLMVEVTGGHQSTDIAQVTILNQPPQVDMPPDRVTWEGSEQVYPATMQDPGTLDTHAFAWDFGDGSPIQDTLAAQHTYADDGTYEAFLTVTDDDGGTVTHSVVTTVLNVDPAVSIYQVVGPYETIFVGDMIEFSGSFTDPGDDSHTVEWDFGDTATATGTLDPTHSYQVNGTYTVTLTVTDDDGGIGVDTFTVRVETTSEAIDDLTEIIEEMNLQNGIENSLDSKLDNAQDALEAANAGNRQDAVNKLEAFINSVEAQRGGKLTDEEADYLIAKAQDIIDHI